MSLLNINSLLLHIDELKLFLSTAKIDILAINETKLDSHIKNHEIQLPGFKLVRRDRNLSGRHGAASSPGALLLETCRYMKRLHEVTACDVVSAQGEMGCVRDGERLADLAAVMANVEISE